MNGDATPSLSADAISELYEALEMASQSTLKSLDPMLKRMKTKDDGSFDFQAGLSLLLVRPTVLLSSIHHLIILIGLHLSSSSSSPSNPAAVPSHSFSSTPHRELPTTDVAVSHLEHELSVVREVMEKVRGLEGKVSYQVKKLVALADTNKEVPGGADAKQNGANTGAENADDEDAEANDPLSFRPNPSALLASSSKAESSRRATSPSRRDRRGSTDDEDEDAPRDGVYRPPRVAAVPYNEQKGKSKRTERRAPALLSEFATSLTSAPLLESTSGLAVRPAVISATGDNASHSNSKSANRLAELTRMNEFEEENMTRLVMTKREAKRREEDEAALMMGFGVGGEARSRSRRQGGFEAELEGVLGERGGKSMWDSVGRGALGRREGLLERSRKRGTEDGGLDEGGQRKKGKFQKQVKRNKRR